MKRESGFTAIELAVVVAIVGIMAAVSLPGLMGWRANQQLSSSAREIQSFINGARLAAIKNNAFITVSFDVASGRVGTTQINRADITIPAERREIRLRPGITMRTDLAGQSFRFNSRGFPVTAVNDYTSGTITVTNARGMKRDIIMALTGNTQIDTF